MCVCPHSIISPTPPLPISLSISATRNPPVLGPHSGTQCFPNTSICLRFTSHVVCVRQRSTQTQSVHKIIGDVCCPLTTLEEGMKNKQRGTGEDLLQPPQMPSTSWQTSRSWSRSFINIQISVLLSLTGRFLDSLSTESPEFICVM